MQHAHQKGIIHRDIKPSNVMVTLHDGVPVPKVIDFGVAKAINQRLTQESVYTQATQMVGTPLYMSPEQAELSGLDIDTRDIRQPIAFELARITFVATSIGQSFGSSEQIDLDC